MKFAYLKRSQVIETYVRVAVNEYKRPSDRNYDTMLEAFNRDWIRKSQKMCIATD